MRIVYFDYTTTCMFQPWNDILCVLSRYRKVSKYWESGCLIGWWSHPLSHRILKRYSVYWASREHSACCCCVIVSAGRCCVSVSCNWQDPDLIDNIIILHTQPGPGHFHVPWPERIETLWLIDTWYIYFFFVVNIDIIQIQILGLIRPKWRLTSSRYSECRYVDTVSV